MPKNNKKAGIRTMLFVMVTALLLLPGASSKRTILKDADMPEFIKEVISWLLPAP